MCQLNFTIPQTNQTSFWQQNNICPQSYNVITNDEHTNVVVEKTRDTIILMIERILTKEKDGKVNTVIDPRVTNYCFADVNAFTKYEKFEILLVERTAENGTKFSIAG